MFTNDIKVRATVCWSSISRIVLFIFYKMEKDKTKISHMSSLISALEQRVEWVEKSLSFDTCKITSNVTLLDKAYLFLEPAVTSERTRFVFLK